jgi:hypothetical protein
VTPVWIGFKAFDCHELLCHMIAQDRDLYSQHDLDVKLLDTTFVPDEALPENTFHVACGAAMTNFLAGRKRKVVFVACDRPMFWLYGRAGVNSVEALAQGRVASFPDAAPPAQFLRRLLGGSGVSCGVLPCRDDTARLGLLASGSVDAALLSSLYLPHEVEARGLNTLAWVGESLRLPSTGLAVSQEMFEQQTQLVATMVGIYQEAMKSIFDDDQLLGQVLVQHVGMPDTDIHRAVALVRECYNPFGFSYETVLQPALDAMAQGMGLNSRPAGELYEFKFIKSHH